MSQNSTDEKFNESAKLEKKRFRRDFLELRSLTAKQQLHQIMNLTNTQQLFFNEVVKNKEEIRAAIKNFKEARSSK